MKLICSALPLGQRPTFRKMSTKPANRARVSANSRLQQIRQRHRAAPFRPTIAHAGLHHFLGFDTKVVCDGGPFHAGTGREPLETSTRGGALSDELNRGDERADQSRRVTREPDEPADPVARALRVPCTA